MTQHPEVESNGPLAIRPTKSYEDCIELCEELGLIETMKHGGNDYIRYTERGVNVLAGLVGMQANIDYDEVLNAS
jgi:hypothetical protein